MQRAPSHAEHRVAARIRAILAGTILAAWGPASAAPLGESAGPAPGSPAGRSHDGKAANPLPGPIDGRLGRLERCDNFFINSALEGHGPLSAVWNVLFGDKDVPDGAWIWVQRGDPTLPRFRDATGRVAVSLAGDYPGGPIGGHPSAADPLPSRNALGDESVVNFEDYPDFHDSHDQNFYILLDPDPAQISVLSSFGIDSRGVRPSEDGHVPDTLEVEWETGILTSQLRGDGRFFPKWAWPVPGDRVWVNGHWIFDCGHPAEGKPLPPEQCLGGLPCNEKGLKTEIHPPRAIATMRQQTATPPTGGAPIPVTATDVYVHGRAGIVVDLLECGGRVVLDNRTCPTRSGETPRGSDSSDGNPGHDIALDHLGTPIDEDFHFTVCTPPLPPGGTVQGNPLTVWQESVASADTVGVPLRWERDIASGACATAGHGPYQVNVTIPLAGTGVTPDSVYARRIYAGWSARPRPLRRFRVTLESMELEDDLDHNTQLNPFEDDDCECVWFWSSIDRAPREVLRLSDHADNLQRMNDFGEGGTMTFSGAAWDFTVPDGEAFTFRTFGFDGGVGEEADDPKQDCLDDHFAHHDFGAHVDLDLRNIPDACIASLSVFDPQDAIDDPFDLLQREFGPKEITDTLGAWPLTGAAQVALASPRRCRVTYGLSPSTRTAKVRCDSAEQAREAYQEQGLIVLGVEEYNQYTLNLRIEALAADSDGDGLVDDLEQSTHHTDPLDADTDDDGLADGAELDTHQTDPLDPDGDDDSLSDGAEVDTHHTNPRDPDSDDDRLPDGVEVEVATDPLRSDSDRDGLADGRDPQFVINAVSALPVSAFSRPGRRAAILAGLARVERRIARRRLLSAVVELRTLRLRMDGCGRVADRRDWIVECVEQARIRRLLDLLLANLFRHERRPR
jgi:hypothetical protein